MHFAPLSFLRIGLAVILIAFLSHTRADPDLWGHVRFGEEIVSTGTVPRADAFSFLSDRAWINHEWLSESVMYLAFSLAGGTGLVLLKLLLVAGVVGGVLKAWQGRVTEPTSRDVLIAFVLMGIFAQANHMRPQVFSLAAFACLLVLLARTHRSSQSLSSSSWMLGAVAALMAVWVNLHGGWIVGGGTLALWTACTLVSAAPRREKALLVAATTAGWAATLINPYGWHMWAFLSETVGFGRADITEWQPVFRIGGAFVGIWLFLALLTLAAASASIRSARLDLRRVAVVIALGLAAFWVNRLMAFFAISLVGLLGPELLALRRRVPAPTRATGQPARAALVAVLIATCMIVSGGTVAAGRNVSCVRMDLPGMPEPEVAQMAKSLNLRGRLLIWFDWGEYAIWHFGQSLPVSIDGRRETVYSGDMLRRHLLFYFVPSTRAEFLEDVKPDYIWLPSRLPVVKALQADGWVPLFTGPQSVFLGKRDEGEPFSMTYSTKRCFPGP
jgi:hypothetical protein